MKKVLMSLALSLALTPSVFASNAFTPFTTLNQAQLYCPAENALTFKAYNSGQNSAGAVTGMNQKVFNSYPGAVIHPKNLDANNIIRDAQFRNANGVYGYNSNGTITCFYSYETFTGSQYALILRAK